MSHQSFFWWREHKKNPNKQTNKEKKNRQPCFCIHFNNALMVFRYVPWASYWATMVPSDVLHLFEWSPSVPAHHTGMFRRDSAVVRLTCMCPWRSGLAEHYFACPRQCVSACVVCSWQTYCASVKMQAATWSTVNSVYPSPPVYHSSSLTIATEASTHATQPVLS